MAKITVYPNGLNASTRERTAIIETPRGSRIKFTYNPDFELFELVGLLPQGMVFLYDFGFIPSTQGEDGDPLDVLVLMNEPTHTGCLLHVRLIGVIEAVQITKAEQIKNDRLVGIAVHSYTHQHFTSIKQVDQALMAQVEQYFIMYNKERGKTFKIKGTYGPQRAVKLVEEGMVRFRCQSGNGRA